MLDVQNFIDFFFSGAALPFLALLAMMLIAFAAIIIFWLQSRRLKLVLEDMYARHQHLAKAVNDMRSSPASPVSSEGMNALSAMLIEQGKVIASLQGKLCALPMVLTSRNKYRGRLKWHAKGPNVPVLSRRPAFLLNKPMPSSNFTAKIPASRLSGSLSPCSRLH